jgi:hypothetical protein
MVGCVGRAQPTSFTGWYHDDVSVEITKGWYHDDESVEITRWWYHSRRQLIPIFDKPAFSRFSQLFQPQFVVHIFGKIVKRQVCQKWGWVADGCDIMIMCLSKSQDGDIMMMSRSKSQDGDIMMSLSKFMLPKRRFWTAEQSVAYAFLNEFSISCSPKRVLTPLKSTSKTHTQRFVPPSKIFVWGA